MGFTFKKDEKLKSKKLIEKLFLEGKFIKKHPIKVAILKVNEFAIKKMNKVGFSVPKKNFKSAVDRNRIKRQLRETYRLNKHIIDEFEENFVMMFIYTDTKKRDYDFLNEKMKEILTEIVKH